MTDLNPQAKQMADESMVRNLDAQAQRDLAAGSAALRPLCAPRGASASSTPAAAPARLPRDSPSFSGAPMCSASTSSTRTWSSRDRATRSLAPRLSFEHQSIFELAAADASFDLTVCRHVIHSIPHPERVLAELGA